MHDCDVELPDALEDCPYVACAGGTWAGYRSRADALADDCGAEDWQIYRQRGERLELMAFRASGPLAEMFSGP